MLEDKIKQVLALGFLVQIEGMAGVVQEDNAGSEDSVWHPSDTATTGGLSITANFVNSSLKCWDFINVINSTQIW